MDKARTAALWALTEVGKDNFSNLAIDQMARRFSLDSQQMAFATALCYGVLERLITLDMAIGQYTKQPVKKLDTSLLWVLRMGFYQLKFLDSVPDSAAVNESVILVKESKNPKAAGFVNAVLRSFLREEKRLPEPKGTQAQKLACTYSCPEWLVENWLKSYGKQATVRILEKSLGRPATYLRVNEQKTTAQQLSEQLTAQQIACEIEPIPSGCLSVGRFGGALTHNELYLEGLFHVQDRASQICALTLGALPGERIADFCAAPGGKSFTIAAQMQNEGELISCDLHQNRVELIKDGAKRLGLTNLKAMKNDASAFDANLGTFDRILCDVPCSGFGVIRRKPEIKYKLYETVQNLPAIQYKILKTSSDYLKIGGTLLYSTCTLLKEENELVVERFLRENKNFRAKALPDWLQIQATHKTFYGEEFDSDGFFIALMERIG